MGHTPFHLGTPDEKLNLFPQGTPEQEAQAKILAEKLKTAFAEAQSGRASDRELLSVARMLLQTPVAVAIVKRATITVTPDT